MSSTKRQSATPRGIQGRGLEADDYRYLSPIGVLHHPLIIAFSSLVLVFALIQRQPLSEALAEAAELGWRFELDISFDEESGATGGDLPPVKGRCSSPSWGTGSLTRVDCLNHLLRFSMMGIWETEIMSLIPVRPFAPSEANRSYQTRLEVSRRHGTGVISDHKNRLSSSRSRSPPRRETV